MPLGGLKGKSPMAPSPELDCITIGYYEPKFADYERIVRQLGEDSEAYRDLKFSFVHASGRKMTYIELLSHAYRLAAGESGNSGDSGNSPEDEFKSGDIPSLAAVYLTNYLRRHGVRASYVNLFLYEQDKLREYLEEKPACVAITTTFYGLNFPVIEIIRAIRRYDQEVKIVVGGPLVANHHRRCPPAEFLVALDDMGADAYVIESQGEATLLRIVQCLRQGGDLARVPNLVYRGADGKLALTAAEQEINSLDENFIDWRRFAGESLGSTLQTRTARSCAFSCAFCAYPTRAGKLTLAGLDTIEQELDAMYEVGGVRNAVFIDDTFNVPLPRFKDICRLMIRKRYGFNWFSYFRCSNSDAEAIDLMAESGCRGVFLGIESGSPTILKNMDKHAAVPQYMAGIRMLRERGILTFGSFITGFPGETEATVRETIDFIKETKPDYYRSQIWYCEPGTPIYFRKDKYGIEGEGFNWVHNTMESLEAMDHIDRAFLAIKDSRWLPQWSFDFWIIPYLLGKGLPQDRFADFMTHANRMLMPEIASVPEAEARRLREEGLRGAVKALTGWRAAR
jgi:radical SAM PhpK family P-methyltransferase